MSSFDLSLLGTLPDIELLSARPLTGGLSNRCWVLELYNVRTSVCSKAVWRPIAESAKAFGLSREHEHKVLESFQSSLTASPRTTLPSVVPPNIAPKSLALLEQGLLVEWVEGSMAGKDLSDRDLLQLQADIHALPVPPWRLDVKQKAAHYWQQTDDRYKSASLQQLFNHFQQLPLQAWFDDTCCHHDLGRYNIICQPDGNKRVIDWEYAAAGDPSLDLALTINANGLDMESAVAAYCQLRGKQDSDRWLAAVTAWQPWCNYLAMLWYYVGASLWQDNAYLIEADRLKQELAPKLAQNTGLIDGSTDSVH